MARLTTHVLDTANGVPAAGIAIDVHAVEGDVRRLVATATTNAEGRSIAPLLTGDAIEIGIYELTFHVADYFRRAGVALTSPPFLGDVVVRIGIADARGHYHVPLLISPYGYSTYRGT
jgi:5-hydroxyisourate hydrolase